MLKRNKIAFSALLLLTILLMNCNGNGNDIISKQLFDLNWKYSFGECPTASEVDFDDVKWESLDLPHSGNQDLDSNEIIWYRKHFDIPQSWSNKNISIYFEGISYPHDLFVNGVLIKDLQKKESSFQVDLNPYLVLDRENLVAVRTTRPNQLMKSSQSGSGIFKHVWLVVKDTSNLKQ